MQALNVLQHLVNNPLVDLQHSDTLAELYQIQEVAIETINTHQGILDRLKAIFSDRSIYPRIAFVTIMVSFMIPFVREVGSLKIDQQETIEIEKEKLEKIITLSVVYGASMGAFIVFDLKDIGELIRVKTYGLLQRVQEIFFNVL